MLVAVADDGTQRCSAGTSLIQTGDDLRCVGFLALCGKRIASRYAARKKGREDIEVYLLPCGKAVDHAADAGSVRLTENGDLQSVSVNTCPGVWFLLLRLCAAGHFLNAECAEIIEKAGVGLCNGLAVGHRYG